MPDDHREKLRSIARRMERQEQRLEELRAERHDAIRAALTADDRIRQAEVIRITGLSRTQVERIAKGETTGTPSRGSTALTEGAARLRGHDVTGQAGSAGPADSDHV